MEWSIYIIITQDVRLDSWSCHQVLNYLPILLLAAALESNPSILGRKWRPTDASF